MKVIKINDIPMVHIIDFAEAAGRSVTSTRNLIQQGNTLRQLLFYRDRSKLYIPLTEVFGYPFISAGGGTHRNIYHYVELDNGKLEKVLCAKCTFDMGCDNRHIADEVAESKWDYGDK